MKGPEVGRLNRDGIVIHDKAEFDGMRAAGQLSAQILDDIAQHVKPGVTTGELDGIIHDQMVAAGARPATLGYKGYPKSSCISVNHVVCHGIPGNKIPGKIRNSPRRDDRLADGDILNIDVTCILDGWYGDTSRMYVAGKLKPFARRLLDATHTALMKGIEAAVPGNTFGDIGAAIQDYIEGVPSKDERGRALRTGGTGMSVVRDFCGHGLGRVFHSAPNVLHFGRPGTGARIEPGMFFTIEPMVNLGKPETRVLKDNWTAITEDKSLSAQFEHSIGITEDGPELFTVSPGGMFHPTFQD